jgi:CheY-like chemotaxis protein
MAPVKILVIEDDDLSRDLLQHLLTREGYTTDSAASGEAALETLAQASELPAVVLSDLNLPGLSGSDLAHRLSNACPSALLLAMSGSKPQEGSLHHFHGFLRKPFTMSALRDAIATQLSREDSAPPIVTASVPLDDETFRKLQKAMPPAKLGQLYRLCLDDAAKRVEAMRTAAIASDDSSYRQLAHAIKGGCGMVGALELQTLATSAENSGIPANHVATFDEFLTALERLESILVANGTLQQRTAAAQLKEST